MKLSILVPTLEQRVRFMERLMGILQPQLTPEVEVVAEKDSGEAHIGTKRNRLLARAAGDYVCFVDDDDRVSSDYVPRILEAVRADPDCVGIEGIYTCERIPKKFFCSLKYRDWFEKDNQYFRSPNHLNPVRRTIALAAGFPEISWGEDVAFSKKILPHLKTEVYLGNPVYFYDYNPANFRSLQARHMPR